MKESEFVDVFENEARKVLSKRFTVSRKANLLYELNLDRHLNISQLHVSSPKRGYSAFQTDIAIFERINKILYPRVILEMKGKVTTHDIITYSSKAGRHKKIYPGLRYGLFASNEKIIPNKFFIHNENLDFFIAGMEYTTSPNLSALKELIKQEIKIARQLEKISFNDVQYKFFRTGIVFR